MLPNISKYSIYPFKAGLYNFRPSVRPVPLQVHIAGFPGKHYCPRMATMNKPAFKAIQTHSPEKPVLIFVSSRRQTRLTALDLIAYLAAEDNPKQWLNMPEEEVTMLFIFFVLFNCTLHDFRTFSYCLMLVFNCLAKCPCFAS